jgi:DNA-binding protein H-NS
MRWLRRRQDTGAPPPVDDAEAAELAALERRERIALRRAEVEALERMLRAQGEIEERQTELARQLNAISERLAQLPELQANMAATQSALAALQEEAAELRASGGPRQQGRDADAPPNGP